MIAGALACLFFGDSTAVGTLRRSIGTAATPCAVVARIGARPEDMARWAAPAVPIGTAVVAAGSNSPASPSLAADLARVRSGLHARRVIGFCLMIAARRRSSSAWRNPTMIMCSIWAELPTGDRLHPQTYAGIATALRRWRIGGD